MTLFLFIAAATGLFIFLIAYLRIVIASFQHHTVTGLISIFPGINLVVLPTVWGKIQKAFLFSLFGLSLAFISWYVGGNQYISYKTNPLKQESPTATESIQQKGLITHKTKEIPLPQKPLYYIVYEQTEVKQLSTLVNQHIRIKLIDDRELKGKNIKTTATSLLLETHNKGKKLVIKISPRHIKTLEKLVQSEK